MFAVGNNLHKGEDDSALEGWPVIVTFAVGKHGNVALLADNRWQNFLDEKMGSRSVV